MCEQGLIDDQESKEKLLHLSWLLLGQKRYSDAVEACQTIARLYGWSGVHHPLAVALTQLGRTTEAVKLYEEAIPRWRKALEFLPRDHLLAYTLGSCLAHFRYFEEADDLFSRESQVPTGDGRAVNSKMIKFSDYGVRSLDLNDKRSFSREIYIDESTYQELTKNTDVVYFVSADPVYFQRFGKVLLRSIKENASLAISVHVHLMNPNGDCFSLISECLDIFDFPIALSYEYVQGHLSNDSVSMRTYYSLARFLMLPRLLEFYNKIILLADIDQLVVRSLAPLVENIRDFDAGLLYFPAQIPNVLSWFSASVVAINPTDTASVFVEGLRDHLLSQLVRLNGQLPWHLDQAALAVAASRAPGLRWYPIPPTVMQSDLHELNPSAALQPDTLFWSVTYSQDSNKEKLYTDLFRQYE